MIDYTVIRSDRRTVSLRLTKEGDVVVRAPRRCSQRDLDEFVQSKSDWILAQRQELLDRKERRDGFSLHTGDVLRLCGEQLRVELRPGLRPGLVPGRLILPTGEMASVRAEILRLSRTHKRLWLEQRLDAWARTMGVSYRELKISSAKCRWGSCTSDGVIRISVFLLFAPQRAIDYVLVHELAHRRHFNHSQDFWTEVAAYMPDYRLQKQILRRYQEEPLVQSLAE